MVCRMAKDNIGKPSCEACSVGNNKNARDSSASELLIQYIDEGFSVSGSSSSILRYG